MSSTKSKKKPLVSRLWGFLTGRNREPSTWDVMSSLAKGSKARAEVNALYKEQKRIENRRIQTNNLTNIIYSTPENDPIHQKAFEELKKVLKK